MGFPGGTTRGPRTKGSGRSRVLWAHRSRDLIKERGAATFWRDRPRGVWSFGTRDSGWRLCPSERQSWAGHFLSLSLTLPSNSRGWLEWGVTRLTVTTEASATEQGEQKLAAEDASLYPRPCAALSRTPPAPLLKDTAQSCPGLPSTRS